MTAHSMPPVLTIEDEKANEFAEVLRAQVREAAEEADASEFALDGHLLAVSLEYVEDQGGISSDMGEGAVGSDEFVSCPFRERVKNTNMMVLGYLPVTTDGQLTLFSARYGDDPAEKTLAQTEFKSRVDQVVRFFRTAYNEPELFETYPSVAPLVAHIDANADRIHEVKVVFVTNLRLTSRDYDRSISLGDIELVYDIYDIERLYKLSDDSVSASDIVVDFQESFGRPIPCLEATGRDHSYKSYLLMLDGTTIHWLFKRYGPRLYDTNLRSYLDNKTRVNKEIMKTAREEPERFLAYNNGLTATAHEIEVSLFHGQPCITRIEGLQIVNGAQTTGSIYKAKEGSRKEKPVDLSKVWVAVKLTKVTPEDLRDFVPRITRYANTQNPIQAADLEANEELHRRLEQLANETWCPGTMTRWFYERTRGAYQAALNREGTTPKLKAEFKRQIPKNQRFGKTDLARYWMAWACRPHVVSKGAQKNFDAFKRLVSDGDGKLDIASLDQPFFKEVIARAIIYQAASKSVTDAEITKIGGFVKTYLVAYLSHRLGDRIDLQAVWQAQAVSQELASLLDSCAPLVKDGMLKGVGDNIQTEWFKKEGCWDDVRAIDLPMPSPLPPECTSSAPVARLASTQLATPHTSSPVAPSRAPDIVVSAPHKDTKRKLDLQDDVAVTLAMSADDWVKAAKWVASAQGFGDWHRNFAYDMAKHASGGWPKPPTEKQAKQAAMIARSAMRASVVQLS